MRDSDIETRELIDTRRAWDNALRGYLRRWGSKPTARLFSVFTEVIEGLDRDPKGSFELNANDHCLTDLVKQTVYRKSKM